MKKVIRTNKKGELLYDIHENEFYIEFGNVQFTLPMDDFLKFERMLKEKSSEFAMQDFTKKIKVPIGNIGIALVLTSEDVASLYDLFGLKYDKLQSFKLKINYSMN